MLTLSHGTVASLRRAHTRDLDAITRLERESFALPNPRSYFADALQDAQRQVWVYGSHDARIEGFLVWHITREEIAVEDLAVRPILRKQQIATRMLEWLCAREAAKRSIAAVVSERNVPAQLLLRKVGFLCESIDREVWREWTSDAAYVFRLRPTRALELGLARPTPTQVSHAS